MKRNRRVFGLVVAASLVLSGVVGVGVAGPRVAGAAGPVPGAPVVTGVSPRGLGVWVAWSPADVAVPVTGVSIHAQAMVVAGVTVPSGCASPAASAAGPSDTAGLVPVPAGCDGVAYQVTVTAANGNGSGPASDPSEPVVPGPAGPPSVPMITSIVGRDGRLIVGWVPPADTGGSPLTRYVLTAQAGTTLVRVRTDPSATNATLSGLTNGVSYRVSLKARNALGVSPATTQRARPHAATVAGPPVGLQVTIPTAGQVAVVWSAPADDGGSPITNYLLIAQPVVQQDNADGSFTWIAQSGSSAIWRVVPDTSLALTGLSTTTWYQMAVYALNAKGAGTAVTESSPSMPQVVIQPGAIPLTPPTLNALTSWDGTTLVWNAPAPTQVGSLAVGNTLAGGISALTPHGLLAKITAISQPSAGSYRIATVPGQLGDVIAQGGFHVETDPNSIANATFVPAVAGVQVLRAQAAIGVSQSLSASITSTNGPVTVKGTATVSGSLSLDFHADTNPLSSKPLLSVTASALGTFTSQLSVTVAKDWSYKEKVGEIDFPSFPVPLGPLVFVIVPKLPIYAVVNAGGQITVSVGTTTTIGGSVSWNSDHPSSIKMKDLSQPPKLTNSSGSPISLSATVSAGFSASAEALIDDVTGPMITFQALAKVTATLPAPAGQPWLEFDLVGSISGGWTIDIGFPFNLRYDLSATLADFTIPLLKLYGSPPDGPIISPTSAMITAGQSLQFTANRPVTWGLAQNLSADTIDGNGLLHAAAIPGRYFLITATDTKNQSNVVPVTVGAAGPGGVSNPVTFDPPANLAGYRDADGKGAALTWTPPTNTLGAPLTKYTIVTSPTTHTTTVTAPAAGTHLTGLDPETGYLITLIATNTNNRTSPTATMDLLEPPHKWKSIRQYNFAYYAVGGTTDADNNSYVTAPTGSEGTEAALLTKLDPSGNVTWQRTISGAHGYTHPTGAAVDTAGNVFMVGAVQSGETITGAPETFGGSWIAKYSGAGVLQWAHELGGNRASSVKADNAGNSYIVGSTSGTIPGSSEQQSGSSDAFVVKLTSLGSKVWAHQLGVSGAGTDGNTISVDSDGGFAIAGFSNGHLQGIPEPYAGGVSDGFVARYSAGGVLSWIRGFGSSSQDSADGVDISKLDNSVVVSFSSLDYSKPSGTVVTRRYDRDGTLSWTRFLGGPTAPNSLNGFTAATGAVIDRAGNSFVTGEISGHLPEAPEPGQGGTADLFVAKYDTSGTLQWVHQLGSTGFDNVFAIALTSLGSPVITGWTDGSIQGSSGVGRVFVATY